MIYGATHLFISLLWLASAFSGGPALWVLLWPAFAFGLAGVAVLLNRPTLLRKTALGRRSPLMTIVLLPYLAALWCALKARTMFGSEPPWHEVSDDLFLGRMARFDEMPSGVDLVVDMTAEQTADPRVIAGRTYLCVPTLYTGAPPPETLQALVEQVEAWKGRVLIHGARGHGRAALVMACVLVGRGVAPSIGVAVAQIQAVRPGVRLSAAQQLAARGGLTDGLDVTQLPEAAV